MKKIFLLFLFLPSLLMADAGTSKKTVLATEKTPEYIEESDVEEERYCGWSQYNFSHTEGGGSYNYGVSSFGSGVWGPGYISNPIQKTVHVSAYTCSPNKYKEVIKTKGGKGE